MTFLLAAATIGGLVPLLVWLLVLALVIYVVFLVVGMIPIPEPAKKNRYGSYRADFSFASIGSVGFRALKI